MPLDRWKVFVYFPHTSMMVTDVRGLSVCSFVDSGGSAASAKEPRFDKITKTVADVFKMVREF